MISFGVRFHVKLLKTSPHGQIRSVCFKEADCICFQLGLGHGGKEPQRLLPSSSFLTGADGSAEAEDIGLHPSGGTIPAYELATNEAEYTTQKFIWNQKKPPKEIALQRVVSGLHVDLGSIHVNSKMVVGFLDALFEPPPHGENVANTLMDEIAPRKPYS